MSFGWDREKKSSIEEEERKIEKEGSLDETERKKNE